MATRRNSAKKAAPRRKAAPRSTSAGVEFNHAMIYTKSIERALGFYRDALGFVVVDSYPGAYARLRSPSGATTVALHCLEKGQRIAPATEGLRLYFEVRRLDAFCAALAERGVRFDQKPKDMPWGWRHAYLRDPDGHEISLYWAGKARLRATKMQ